MTCGGESSRILKDICTITICTGIKDLKCQCSDFVT